MAGTAYLWGRTAQSHTLLARFGIINICRTLAILGLYAYLPTDCKIVHVSRLSCEYNNNNNNKLM